MMNRTGKHLATRSELYAKFYRSMTHKRIEYLLRRWDNKFAMMHLCVGNELGILYHDHGLSDCQVSWLGQYLELQYLVRTGYWKLVERTLCRWKGHDLRAAIGSVECGSEDLWCNRCGFATRVYHS